MSYDPVCIRHNSAECNFSKTLTAYTVFHSLCVQNKMFQAVGSIKVKQLENFLTNTCKPYRIFLWITVELWVSVLKPFFFLSLGLMI